MWSGSVLAARHQFTSSIRPLGDHLRMTLVVSVVSQDCVWQAVDRRLTSFQSGKPVSVDANKAVNFANWMIFGFTGPSRLGGQETPSWIADRLAEHSNLDRSVSELASSVQWEADRLPPALCNISVDGVGWKCDVHTGEVIANFVRISNFIDAEGTPLAENDFCFFDGNFKSDRLMNVRASGQPVAPETGRFWVRRIRKRIAAGAWPSDVGRCLVQFVRAVAATNPAVGSGVLVSAIPKAAIGSGTTVSSMPMRDVPTFMYFPEGSNTPIEKGPEFASPGSRMSDFRGETKPNGDQTVSVGIKRVELKS